jgi:hypothetical protein
MILAMCLRFEVIWNTACHPMIPTNWEASKTENLRNPFMTATIQLSESKTVELSCSVCNRRKIVDMVEYLDRFDIKKLKWNCKCGSTWTANLEKRQYPRKPTGLPGYFVVFQNDKWIDSGDMVVADISSNGLGLKINRKNGLKVGDWLEVDFNLDNKSETFILKMVQVRNIHFPFVGTAFEKSDCQDPDIGFYLKEERTPS